MVGLQGENAMAKKNTGPPTTTLSLCWKSGLGKKTAHTDGGGLG